VTKILETLAEEHITSSTRMFQPPPPRAARWESFTRRTPSELFQILARSPQQGGSGIDKRSVGRCIPADDAVINRVSDRRAAFVGVAQTPDRTSRFTPSYGRKRWLLEFTPANARRSLTPRNGLARRAVPTRDRRERRRDRTHLRAVGAKLWLSGRWGFHLDDRHRRVRGLDYWDALTWQSSMISTTYSWARNVNRSWLFSTKAQRTYSEVAYEIGDALIFGPEGPGPPHAILAEQAAHSLHPHAPRSPQPQPGKRRRHRALRRLSGQITCRK